MIKDNNCRLLPLRQQERIQDIVKWSVSVLYITTTGQRKKIELLIVFHIYESLLAKPAYLAQQYTAT